MSETVKGKLQEIIDNGLEVKEGSEIIGKVGIDQTINETTNKVNAQNNTHDNLNCNANLQLSNADCSNSNPIFASSYTSNISASQTRASDTTAYTALDVVGESPASNLTFSNIVSVNGGGFFIVGASLRIDVAAIPSGMSGFRLHLYSTAPTAITDNSAYNLPSADRDKYLGYISLATAIDLGDTLWSQNDNLNFKHNCNTDSKSIYGILQTIGAYTPSSATVKKITLKIMQA